MVIVLPAKGEVPYKEPLRIRLPMLNLVTAPKIGQRRVDRVLKEKQQVQFASLSRKTTFP
jgi:hypothetical protein